MSVVSRRSVGTFEASARVVGEERVPGAMSCDSVDASEIIVLYRNDGDDRGWYVADVSVSGVLFRFWYGVEHNAGYVERRPVSPRVVWVKRFVSDNHPVGCVTQ